MVGVIWLAFFCLPAVGSCVSNRGWAGGSLTSGGHIIPCMRPSPSHGFECHATDLCRGAWNMHSTAALPLNNWRLFVPSATVYISTHSKSIEKQWPWYKLDYLASSSSLIGCPSGKRIDLRRSCIWRSTGLNTLDSLSSQGMSIHDHICCYSLLFYLYMHHILYAAYSGKCTNKELS